MYEIPLIKPLVTETLKARVLEVLESGYWTEGPVTHQFERAIADYCGAARCLATTSCTAGLEMALRCLGVGPGDEVLAPDYTYPATADVVSLVGADIVLVDVDPETMVVDYDALEAAVTRRTKAAIPVSLFGNPLDWKRLNSLKTEHGIFMIEDAACALGSSFNDHMTGSLADITVFSHHPRKFISTGEGGTVTTDNDSWADWMHSFKHFGMESRSGRLEARFVRPGANLKLSNLLAAVGLEQMSHIDELLAERRRLAAVYSELLESIPGVKTPRTTPGGKHSWQTFCVFVDERDHAMAGMRSQGIEAQIGTYSLHLHPAFAQGPGCRWAGDLSGSRSSFEHALALPLFHGMTRGEQERVAETLRGFVS